MKRIRLRVAYDGTDFCGWQIQKNGYSVEECLNNALFELTGEKIKVIGASRTDAGVHARGNVAVFDTESPVPADKFSLALNSYLPAAVRIMESDQVDDNFHPRYVNSKKSYFYQIIHARIAPPDISRYAYHVYGEFDLEKIREISHFLVGEHDFSAFCSSGSQVKDKVREIYSVEIKNREIEHFCNPGHYGMISIDVKGNGFLYNMVRIIAGTLIEIGQGRRDADCILRAFETLDRDCLGATAPARGLFLEGIEFV